MKPIEFILEPQIVSSYKRLSYTAWYALAELVDNSYESFRINKARLKSLTDNSATAVTVRIRYDRKKNHLTVSDNAAGMDLAEVRKSLQVGSPPERTDGLSQYGLGLKTSAFWLGNKWSITTKKFGSPEIIKVSLDVDRIAADDRNIDPDISTSQNLNDHYTVIAIDDMNRVLHSRTVGRTKQFLSSLYRELIRKRELKLFWGDDQILEYGLKLNYVKNREGKDSKRDFKTTVNGKRVSGTIGVLSKGGRQEAGIAIIRRNRLIQGQPDAWRPELLFGQVAGTNNLINQRLAGEIRLDDFHVSHTKNAILFSGNEEEELEQYLYDEFADYITLATNYRAKGTDKTGPSDVTIQTAVSEIEDRLSSDFFTDFVSDFEASTTESTPSQIREQIAEYIETKISSTNFSIGDTEGTVYYASELSSNDPYILVESESRDKLSVIINLSHPFVDDLISAESLLAYMHQCVFDGLAEWKAIWQKSQLDPSSIRWHKDNFLRLPFKLLQHIKSKSV